MRPTDDITLNRIRQEVEIMRLLGNHQHVMRLVDVYETTGEVRLVLDL
jgi:hypothetical protein